MSDHIALAQLCELAYTQAPDIQDNQGIAAAIVQETDNVVTVAFRGTQPEKIDDDLADLDIGPIQLPRVGMVHKGFWDAASRIAEQVDDMASNRQVILTGHSLGGALAIALAAHRTLMAKPTWGVVAFGAPRVGIGGRLGYTLSSIPVTIYRHRSDIVPLLPPHISHVIAWDHPVALTQLGEAGVVPSMEDHAISAYIASLKLQSRNQI